MRLKPVKWTQDAVPEKSGTCYHMIHLLSSALFTLSRFLVNKPSIYHFPFPKNPQLLGRCYLYNSMLRNSVLMILQGRPRKLFIQHNNLFFREHIFSPQFSLPSFSVSIKEFCFPLLLIVRLQTMLQMSLNLSYSGYLNTRLSAIF